MRRPGGGRVFCFLYLASSILSNGLKLTERFQNFIISFGNELVGGFWGWFGGLTELFKGSRVGHEPVLKRAMEAEMQSEQGAGPLFPSDHATSFYLPHGTLPCTPEHSSRDDCVLQK